MIDISSLTYDEKIYMVCLYFARLNSGDENYRGFTSKLKLLAEKYNKKYNTIKQDKDRFDAQFDNERSGWHQAPLEKQNRRQYELYMQYKDTPIDELKDTADRILEQASRNDQIFLSIKTKDRDTVDAILAKNSNIIFDGINILKDLIALEQIVFIVLGGDNPPWDTGFIGMGVVSRLPFDEGYDLAKRKNFKIGVDIKLIMNKPIKREDLVPYRNTYGIIGIAPITKWEPNQALSQVEEKKAIALMRAMLELAPEIEDDLTSLIEPQLMGRVKGATVMLIPVEVEFGEPLPETYESEDFQESSTTEDFVDVYNPDIERMSEGFVINKQMLLTLKHFINTGKHIIFTGPPGTGKTTIAERACEEAVSCNFISGYTLTTAVADWSTFDTIGGYMPDQDGQLVFTEGIFLKSLRNNHWLIIDEINRAEVDKAFGHFFTVLSKKNIELPFLADTSSGKKNVSIKHTDNLGSFYDSENAVYYVGRNWRILGTMNTYDKNSLFTLSYAFMRRFAMINIPAPSVSEYDELFSLRIEDEEIKNLLLKIITVSPRKMGAAIMLDIIAYIKTPDRSTLVDGICSIIIPQYEGISFEQIKVFKNELSPMLPAAERSVLVSYLCEFFDINEQHLGITAVENDD